MSETTEPATIKDLVERFRKFSFRSETYPIKRGGNFVYQFDAAEIAPQQRVHTPPLVIEYYCISATASSEWQKDTTFLKRDGADLMEIMKLSIKKIGLSSRPKI
ncbi:hypothetical protein OXX79_008404 [Metschnikowia pulcherrima]